MNEFQIDPSQGPEAAADATNDQLETLLRIVMWELAMRTSKDQFDHHLNRLARARAEMVDDLNNARNKREQHRFTASVMQDQENSRYWVRSGPSRRPVSIPHIDRARRQFE